MTSCDPSDVRWHIAPSAIITPNPNCTTFDTACPSVVISKHAKWGVNQMKNSQEGQTDTIRDSLLCSWIYMD